MPADRPTVTLKGIAGNPNSGRLAILDIQGVGVRFLRAGQSVKAPGASGPTVIRVRDISRDAVSVDVGNVSEELR